MRYDKPLIAGIFGAISSISGEIATRTLLSFGIGKYSVYQLYSLLVTINRPSEFMGFIVNCIAGGSIGVFCYYAFGIIGRDYLIAKTVAINVVFWLFAEIIFTATIEGHFIDIRPVSDYYVHLFGVIIYGITLGVLFKAYLFNTPTSSKYE